MSDLGTDKGSSARCHHQAREVREGKTRRRSRCQDTQRDACDITCLSRRSSRVQKFVRHEGFFVERDTVCGMEEVCAMRENELASGMIRATARRAMMRSDGETCPGSWRGVCRDDSLSVCTRTSSNSNGVYPLRLVRGRAVHLALLLAVSCFPPTLSPSSSSAACCFFALSTSSF